MQLAVLLYQLNIKNNKEAVSIARKTRMNSITSAEKTAKINKENLRLKDDFLSYLRSLRRSEGTIAGYDNDLLIVFTFIMENLDNKDFHKLTKRDIIAIQNWLVDNGNSPARIRRIKSALSSLSNFCENILADDDPEYNNYRAIVRKVENPVSSPVREKTVLEEQQIEELLSKLTKLEQYDKACMLALAMYSGRRKAELVRFRVSDFDEDHLVCDGALYKSSPIKTKGRGIDGKQLNCFTLAKKFKPYLDAWMQYRQENGIKSEWLFPDRTDFTKQMQTSTLNSWATIFTRLLGVDFYWHCMRHAAVTSLVRAGIPDSVVQQYIGWSDISMVPVYVDIDADEQLGMYFSNGDIDVSNKKGLSEL